MDETIMITVERYNELLRKEFGYEYRRAELLDTKYITPTQTDKFVFQLDKVEEKPVDDDF